METKIRTGLDLELDSEVPLKLQEVDIPDLLARFRIMQQ